MPIQPILPDTLVNGPNWQCRLAGSSKMVPRILIFSIALGAEYSVYVKSIATYVPQKVDIIIHSQAVCLGSKQVIFLSVPVEKEITINICKQIRNWILVKPFDEFDIFLTIQGSLESICAKLRNLCNSNLTADQWFAAVQFQTNGLTFGSRQKHCSSRQNLLYFAFHKKSHFGRHYNCTMGDF